jgi:type II secretory pathway component PulF
MDWFLSLIGRLLVAGLLLSPLIGVAIRVVLRLVYGVRGPQPGSQVYSILNVIAWSLIILGLLLWSLATYFMLFVLLIVIAAAALEYVLARRDMQRDSAWALVGQASRSGQSVADMVGLQQDRFSGAVRHDLRGFASSLSRGESLPTAVSIWNRAFPREAQGYAALSRGSGQVAFGPESEERRHATEIAGSFTQFGYLMWVLLVLTLMITFQMIYIVPSFQKIFQEFDMDLPDTTKALFATANIFGGALFPLVVLLTLGLLTFALVVFICYLADFPILQGLGDRLFFARHRAQLMRLLAIAAEEGMPFETAIGNLASGNPRYPAPRMTRRLHKALRLASSGADWKDALASARLAQPSDVPLLAAAERARNLPWALRALAERTLSRSLLRWETARQIAFPLAILAVGLVVMWCCVGLFMPLVKLIGDLA